MTSVQRLSLGVALVAALSLVGFVIADSIPVSEITVSGTVADIPAVQLEPMEYHRPVVIREDNGEKRQVSMRTAEANYLKIGEPIQVRIWQPRFSPKEQVSLMQ